MALKKLLLAEAMSNIQIDHFGKLRHFLTISGLSKEAITLILDTADSFISDSQQEIRKVPLLRGITVAILFFEASTRTRTTFELAAKRLCADVLNVNISTSATSKGESLIDTIGNLQAMQCDMFVVRHNCNGAAHFIAQHVQNDVAVINGGDGRHAHPTQALLDMLTIRRHKGDFAPLTVAIVGDILHSRVARSQITALTILGVNEIRVIGPKTLLPIHIEDLGVKIFHHLEDGIRDADVIIMLRLQKERMQQGLLPSEHEYFQTYGLTTKKLALAKKDALVMHPGPINRGIEISSTVADGPQSVILQQVTYGIAIRMAVLAITMGNQQ